MKPINKYVVLYAVSILVWTVLFRASLSYSLGLDSTLGAIATIIFYFLSMYLSGWFFGKKANEYLPLAKTSFMFHLITYFVHNGVSYLWFKFGFASTFEQYRVIKSSAIYWGCILLVHIIVYVMKSKDRIKSIPKEEIFE